MTVSILSPIEQCKQFKKTTIKFLHGLPDGDVKDCMIMRWELTESFLNSSVVNTLLHEMKKEYTENTCLFVHNIDSITCVDGKPTNINAIPIDDLMRVITLWNDRYIDTSERLEITRKQTESLFYIAKTTLKEFPLCFPVIIPDIPFVSVIPQPIKRERDKAKLSLEKELEDDLMEWMLFNGIEAENQVKSQSSRTDIWLPNYFFLELKRGNITGNDVCQAIDYYHKFKRPIILVGTKLLPQSKKGIDSINDLLAKKVIYFVDWVNIKDFVVAAVCHGVMGMSNFN